MIHHLALRSADIEALAEFYGEVFDLAVVRDSRPRSLWLGIGDEAVLMLWSWTGDISFDRYRFTN